MTAPRILVIGAGPGIGLAVARRFAFEGFQPTLVVRRDEDQASLAPHLPPTATFHATNLEAPGTLDELPTWLAHHVPDPEVVLYNASTGTPGPASSLGPDALERSLRVNVQAPLVLSQALLPGLRRRGSGTLLFTGGGLALSPKASETALSIGKTALRALAFCLAEELGPEGIHVATLTVAGFVHANQPLTPDAVADAAWNLHREPRDHWRTEVILRPPFPS